MQTPNRVVVTGAASGIGKATAERFAREGWDVCLTDRQDKVEQVRDNLPAGSHLAHVADYTDTDQVEAMRDDIAAQWGHLDALINCAGLFFPNKIIDSSMEDWRQDLDTMVYGAVHMTRACVPLMTEGGRVVHVTSVMARRVGSDYSSYCMAKAALDQYCRALALELADDGILVNAIAPGFVDTPLSVIDGVNELETDWFRTNFVEGQRIPLRRAAQPEEIAGVAYFLAGPDATYITGSVITVDGGMMVTL